MVATQSSPGRSDVVFRVASTFTIGDSIEVDGTIEKMPGLVKVLAPQT